jgi:hypothetical protein
MGKRLRPGEIHPSYKKAGKFFGQLRLIGGVQMKEAKRQCRFGDEYPHIIRKSGRRSTWRSGVEVRLGQAEAQIDAKIRLTHPEPLDSQGNLTAPARKLLLDAAVRDIAGGGESLCIVWAPDSCTFVGPQGRLRNSDLPPMDKPFYVRFGTNLPPLKLERCFSVALDDDDSESERFLCAQRIGRLVEIVEGEHMVLGHLPDEDIPTDHSGMVLPDTEVLRRLPKTYRGAQITGYVCGGILGPVQPAELARPVILNDPWPDEVAHACEQMAGYRLSDQVIDAVWEAVRERRPALLRAA